MQVIPYYYHPVVNPQGYVVTDNLKNWSHNDHLGLTVRGVAELFEKPPQPSPPRRHSSSRPKPASPPSLARTDTQRAIIPSSYPEIDRLDTEQIENLLQDDVAFEDFLVQIDAVKSMLAVRDELKSGNAELTRKSQASGGEIDKVKAKIETAAAKLSTIKAAYDLKVARQQEVLKRYSPEVLTGMLIRASEEAEEKSDDIADKFVKGDMTIKEFNKVYLKERSLYHLRLAKKERFGQMSR